MKYSMTVVIKNPNTEPGTVSEKLLRFKCCFMRDDADIIEQKMLEADVLVFATPIYY